MNPMLPVDSVAIGSMLHHFQKTALVMTSLVALMITARITLSLISSEGVISYGSIFKDAVLYFALINLFPICFRYGIDILGGAALRFAFSIPNNTDEGSFKNAVSLLKDSSIILRVFSSVGPWLICHLAQTISTLLISILVAIGPVVIFMNTMLGFTRGISPYLSAVIGLCLWPLLWNLLGSLSVEIWPSFQETSLMQVVYWTCVSILQLLSPLFCIVLFKTLAPGAAIISATSKIVSKIPMKVG